LGLTGGSSSRARAAGGRIGIDGGLPVSEVYGDGGDLKRELVAGTQESLWSCVEFDHLVSPGIVTKVGIEGLSCLLLQVGVVELGSLGDDTLHPEAAVGLDEAIAELREGEGLETLLASLQLLEVEAEVLPDP
jgi:hypothetical protein